MAVGLSDDQKMGTAGIDDVLACQLSKDSNNTIYAKDMWNPEDQKTYGRRNEINDVSMYIIVPVRVRMWWHKLVGLSVLL